MIHSPVTRTGDNYIMFLSEKELTRIASKLASSGCESAQLCLLSWGVTSRLMFYFSFLHLFFPRIAAGSRLKYFSHRGESRSRAE